MAQRGRISSPNTRRSEEGAQARNPAVAPPIVPQPNAGAMKECTKCDKMFERQSALEQHFLTHTGEKPHQCDMCGRCFSIRSNLRRHDSTCKKVKELRSQGSPLLVHSTALTTASREDVARTRRARENSRAYVHPSAGADGYANAPVFPEARSHAPSRNGSQAPMLEMAHHTDTDMYQPPGSVSYANHFPRSNNQVHPPGTASYGDSPSYLNVSTFSSSPSPPYRGAYPPWDSGRDQYDGEEQRSSYARLVPPGGLNIALDSHHRQVYPPDDSGFQFAEQPRHHSSREPPREGSSNQSGQHLEQGPDFSVEPDLRW